MNPTTSERAAGAALTTKKFAVLRKHLRFSLAGEADVTALGNDRHVVARVSALSAYGCYLNTPDIFSVGTQVRLFIRYRGSSCELPGRVIYVHQGWGMGVLFGDAAGEQFDVLDGWLAELEQKERGGVDPDSMAA